MLQDYELKFGLWDKHAKNTWHGGVATIQYRPGAEVWGVVWTLSNDNLTSLDKWGTCRCRSVPEGNGWRFNQTCDRCLCVCVLSQEGVSLGKYSPLEVTVETDQGMIQCRTYQINNFYACPPSPQYKRVNTQTPKPRQNDGLSRSVSVTRIYMLTGMCFLFCTYIRSCVWVPSRTDYPQSTWRSWRPFKPTTTAGPRSWIRSKPFHSRDRKLIPKFCHLSKKKKKTKLTTRLTSKQLLKYLPDIIILII